MNAETGKYDGAIQERLLWCTAPELFGHFMIISERLTIETFATERYPAQVYPIFQCREQLAEITDPESLIRCIVTNVGIVSKCAANISI